MAQPLAPCIVASLLPGVAGAQTLTWGAGGSLSTDNAIFAGPSGTVTIGSSVSAGNVRFDIANYTLSFAGATNRAVGATSFSGSNTYTGATNISSGRLTVTGTLATSEITGGNPPNSGTYRGGFFTESSSSFEAVVAGVNDA